MPSSGQERDKSTRMQWFQPNIKARGTLVSPPSLSTHDVFNTCAASAQGRHILRANMCRHKITIIFFPSFFSPQTSMKSLKIGAGGINCTKYSHKNCNVQLIFTECFSASVVCQALAHFFFYILFYFILFYGKAHTKRERKKKFVKI